MKALLTVLLVMAIVATSALADTGGAATDGAIETSDIPELSGGTVSTLDSSDGAMFASALLAQDLRPEL